VRLPETRIAPNGNLRASIREELETGLRVPLDRHSWGGQNNTERKRATQLLR